MLGGKALELLTPTTGIQVDLSRCVHRRFSRTSCRRCAQNCPSGAIVVEQGPRIDLALCTGCRLCEAACPAGALAGDERAIGALAKALAEHSRPVLGCRAPGVEAHVYTGCLGFLEIEGLLALALFFPAGLTLNLVRCEGCPSAGMLSALEGAAERLRQLAGDACAGRLRLARTVADLDYREEALSRREFFTFLRRRSSDTAKLAAARLQNAPEPPDGGRKILPPRRRLLLRALPLLSPEQRPQVEAQLFPALSFEPSCTGCTGCAGICPTGALATTTDDPPRPLFIPQLCTGCSLCAEFCRKGGIARSSQ
jgi:ferredoxin